MRHLAALAVAAVLLLGACGDDDGGEVDTGDGSTTTSAAPTGPVSVAEAVELADGTEVTVEAFVLAPGEGATVMCDALGESFPPRCTGPELLINGLDVDALPGVQTTDPGDFVAPATWTEAPVEVEGTLVDGALQVSA